MPRSQFMRMFRNVTRRMSARRHPSDWQWKKLIPSGLVQTPCLWVGGVSETVSFVETEGSHELVTLAVVGELPDEGREYIYRLLLEAMFRDGGSGGAIFSLEPGTKRIWAHRRDSLATMDEEGFRAMLERFVNGMEEWRRIVSGLSALAPKLAEAEGMAESSRERSARSRFASLILARRISSRMVCPVISLNRRSARLREHPIAVAMVSVLRSGFVKCAEMKSRAN